MGSDRKRTVSYRVPSRHSKSSSSKHHKSDHSDRKSESKSSKKDSSRTKSEKKNDKTSESSERTHDSSSRDTSKSKSVLADIFGVDSDDSSSPTKPLPVAAESAIGRESDNESVILSDLEDSEKKPEQNEVVDLQVETADDVTYSEALPGKVRTARTTGAERQSVRGRTPVNAVFMIFLFVCLMSCFAASAATHRELATRHETESRSSHARAPRGSAGAKEAASRFYFRSLTHLIICNSLSSCVLMFTAVVGCADEI